MRAQPLEVLRTYMKGNFTLDLDNDASQTLWDECQKAEDENTRLAKALRHCKGLFEDIQTEEDLQLVCGLCGNGLTHIDMILKPNSELDRNDPPNADNAQQGGSIRKVTTAQEVNT